jgi:hypothetical protein
MSFMLTNQEPDWNIDYLTDTEIYAAIRYLEPNPRSTNERSSRRVDGQNDDSGVLICVGLCLVLFACLGLWLYWR